jgi:hypothetical protein
VLVWRLIQRTTGLEAEGPIAEHRFAHEAISQILLSPDETSMLISTLVSDHFFDLDDGRREVKPAIKREATWKWINHPSDSSRLIYVTAAEAHVHSWKDVMNPNLNLCPRESIPISSDLFTDMVLKDVAVSHDYCKFAVEFANVRSSQSTIGILFFASSAFSDGESDKIQPLPIFSSLGPVIEHLIGVVGSRVYFLSRRLWICSFDLEYFHGTYDQHFCIPDDWFNPNWELLLKVTSKGDFVFVLRAELAVIKQAKIFREVLSV